MNRRRSGDQRVIADADVGVDALRSWMKDLFSRNSLSEMMLDGVLAGWMNEVCDQYQVARQTLERERMLHKVLHTKEVVEAGLDISKGEKGIDWNFHQVSAVCLLHDVARFRQSLLGGFSDVETNYDHAEEGAVILEHENWGVLDMFDMDRGVVVEAVRQHSRMVCESVDPYVLLTRDADKLASLRYMPYLLRCRVFARGGYTQGALRAYRDKGMVKNADMNTLADVFLAWASWEFDMNFLETKRRYVNEGIKSWIMSRLSDELGKSFIDGDRE